MINKETYEAMERIDKLSIELATAFIKSQNIIIAELQNDIDRQKEDIENLKVQNEKLKKFFTVEIAVDEKKLEEMIEKSADEIVKRNLKELRAEVIREFAKRLKKEIDMICYETGFEYQETIDTIDSLVKEMTEGENG